MKKVLHLLPSNSFSGAEKVAISIVKNLEGYHSIYVSKNGDIKDQLEENKVKYQLLENFNLGTIRKLVKLYNPDIIHAHDFKASIISIFFSRKTKIISHIHQNPKWLNENNFKSIVYRVSTIFFSKILLVSPMFNDKLISNHKTTIVNNPVDTKEIDRLSKQNTTNVQSDVLFVGRLEEIKGINTLIDIFNVLDIKNNNIKIKIIGDGTLKEKLKSFINEKDLDDNIEMHGFVNNPYPFIKNTKVVLMPSKEEGFGLVAAEAMYLGVPVLVSNIKSLENIVSPNYFLVCDTIEDYRKKTIYYLDYYQFENENYLIDKVKKNYASEVYFENINKIYKSLYNKKVRDEK